VKSLVGEALPFWKGTAMSRKHTRAAKQAVKSVSSVTGSALTRLTDALPDAEDLEELGSRAADRLASAGQRGMAEARKGLRSAANVAKEHPGATAGALLGVGVLVGAVAHRAFHRTPTLGELLMRSLGQQLERLDRTARSAAKVGLQMAASPLRKALR
jgi:hypothetical protein